MLVRLPRWEVRVLGISDALPLLYLFKSEDKVPGTCPRSPNKLRWSGELNPRQLDLTVFLLLHIVISSPLLPPRASPAGLLGGGCLQSHSV